MAGDDIFEKLRRELDTQNARYQLPNYGGNHVLDQTRYVEPEMYGDQFGTDVADGTFRLFDTTLVDNILIDGIEQEVIAISSPPSKLFRMDRERSTIDRTTGEAQIRNYFPPTVVFGNYEAPAPIQELAKYGIAESEEIKMFFNLNWLMTCAGGQIREGDIIQTYDGKLWEVIDSVINQEIIWSKNHNELTLKRVKGEGYQLPGIGDISDSPLIGTPDGITPKGTGRNGSGGGNTEVL